MTLPNKKDKMDKNKIELTPSQEVTFYFGENKIVVDPIISLTTKMILLCQLNK